MSHNAGDPNKVEAQETLAEAKHRQYMEDIRFMLTNDPSRRFLKHFFTWCKILGVYAAQNSGIYFHEGHRNCGKRIWEDICEADPQGAATLQVELTLEEKEIQNAWS